MPQESKKPIVKDEFTLPEVDLEQDQSQRALTTQQQVEKYRQRNAAVTENDREAFQDYLNRKAEAMPAAKAPPTAEQEPPPPTKISRRGMLKAVMGTAGAGAAAWATYSSISGGSVSDQVPSMRAIATPKLNATTSTASSSIRGRT